MRIAIGSMLVLLAACSRSHSSPADADTDAQGAVDARQSALDAAPPAAPEAEQPPPATFVGARRAHLAKLDDEPGLARNAAVIRAHFDGGVPSSMELQEVPLGSGRDALMLGVTTGDPNPIVLTVDGQGAPLWVKEHPLGGITPPARPFALAPRPDRGLALFVYDEPTKLVAARMWADDGSAYAELVLFELARCDAISAAWWPGQGWIIVTSFPGGARAQLLGEQGMPAWGAQGVAVGEGWRAPAPATIVIEPETSTWFLVQHATRSAADHVVALHYGRSGVLLDRPAMDLGPVPRVAKASERVEASLVPPRVLRVDVGGKAVETQIVRGP